MQDVSSPFDDPGTLAKAIAEATDDVIFAKDLAGRYRYANPATLAAVGCPREQVIGRTDLEFMADPDVARALMATDLRVLQSGEATEVEEPVALSDGTVRYWLSRKMPLRDDTGRVVGLLGVGRDITQRKIEQAEREADRLRLTMGIQVAGLVMAEIDYRSNQNHISAELARLLELGDEDMTVPRQAIFDRIHPEDRGRYLEEVAAAIDPQGDGILATDVRALLPSGATRWLHIRMQVVFAPVGGRMQPITGYCAARDVTQEILAEQQLRDADQRKDEFIATLAHELRNPLAPIRNGLEILRRVGELPPLAARTRDMMERQLGHMVRLVDDLLDVSRISRGKLELKMAPLAMAEAVQHALESCQPAVDAAGHTLSVDLPPATAMVVGDLTRLSQVLSNLVNNAVRYTPAGGSIRVCGREEDGDVVVEVADNGNGIAPAMLAQVFELFTQGGRQHGRESGLGVGLWLVRRLVELHGGSICVASEGEGRGCRFTVRLPRA